MTVTLYSVEVSYLNAGVKVVSVAAEEKPKTYSLHERAGGGFGYRSTINKRELLTLGIAFSRAAAIVMFIAARQRTIERLRAEIDCEAQQILAAEKLRGENA